jgi:hypothetical protein
MIHLPALFEAVNGGNFACPAPRMRHDDTTDAGVTIRSLTSGDQTLKLWDIERGAELYTLRGHTMPVLSVALTASGGRAVSGSSDGLSCSSPTGGARLPAQRTPRSSCGILHLGLSSGRSRAITGGVSSLALSEDGRMLVSGRRHRPYDLGYRRW